MKIYTFDFLQCVTAMLKYDRKMADRRFDISHNILRPLSIAQSQAKFQKRLFLGVHKLILADLDKNAIKFYLHHQKPAP